MYRYGLATWYPINGRLMISAEELAAVRVRESAPAQAGSIEVVRFHAINRFQGCPICGEVRLTVLLRASIFSV